MLVVYNHRPWRRPSVGESVRLVVRDARMKAWASWRMSEWTIDRSRGVWAYAFGADCEAAGVTPLPRAGLFEGSIDRLYGPPGVPVWRRNADKYAKLAVMPKTADNVAAAVGDGQFTLDLDMPGHSVRLIQLTPGRTPLP